jgi:hypothetical protein
MCTVASDEAPSGVMDVETLAALPIGNVGKQCRTPVVAAYPQDATAIGANNCFWGHVVVVARRKDGAREYTGIQGATPPLPAWGRLNVGGLNFFDAAS